MTKDGLLQVHRRPFRNTYAHYSVSNYLGPTYSKARVGSR